MFAGVLLWTFTLFEKTFAVFKRGGFGIFPKDFLKVGETFIAKARGNFSDIHVAFYKKILCLLNTVKVDIFVNGISGKFFKNSTEIAFADIKMLCDGIQ